jgi:IclR family transcriptional regulator, KDG regulon repressor
MATRGAKPRLIKNERLALEQLVQEVGEVVHLSALHGAEVLTLLTRPTSHAVAARNWVGQKIPAYCTSSGRALLFEPRTGRAVRAVRTGAVPAAGSERLRRRRRARAPDSPVPAAWLRHRRRGIRAGPGGGGGPDPRLQRRRGRCDQCLSAKFRLGTRLDPTGELVRAAAGRLSEGLGAPVRPDALGCQCPNEIDLQ